MPPTIATLLERARSRLVRVDAAQAARELAAGALVVDTRPAAQRAAHGEIPGAVVVGRNVLEWRRDPRSPSRLPGAVNHDARAIVVCAAGFSASLPGESLNG